MNVTDWRRDRLEQAVRNGEIVKLTGPRSISDPGQDAPPTPKVQDGHDRRHHVVYDCDGAQHTKVWAALREAGVELVEAGPESFYARDIQVQQRAADAAQFARAKAEVHRLRASIVESLRDGDLVHVRAALTHAEKLGWDWHAGEKSTV